MINFSVGEPVIIRYGREQGQKATIVRRNSGDSYMVRTEDGAIFFFSSKGLSKEKEPVKEPVLRKAEALLQPDHLPH